MYTQITEYFGTVTVDATVRLFDQLFAARKEEEEKILIKVAFNSKIMDIETVNYHTMYSSACKSNYLASL